MLGATDHRIGAVAADITWNNLGRALFPNAGGNQSGSVQEAVGRLPVLLRFRRLPPALARLTRWAASPARPARPAAAAAGSRRSCARLYQRAAAGAPLDAGLAGLLADSSPASVLGGMRAPTLLSQGEQDSLFGLGEADANARQLAQAGAPVQLRWRAGGHDAPSAGDDVAGWQRQFFIDRLRRQAGGVSGLPALPAGAGISATNGRRVNSTLRAASYPGLEPADRASTGFTSTPVGLSGASQQISAPAGGTPAAVTSLPGLGQVIGAAQGAVRWRRPVRRVGRVPAVPAARPDSGIQLRATEPSRCWSSARPASRWR